MRLILNVIWSKLVNRIIGLSKSEKLKVIFISEVSVNLLWVLLTVMGISLYQKQ